MKEGKKEGEGRNLFFLPLLDILLSLLPFRRRLRSIGYPLERRKEGRKEGRTEGRTDGRTERRKERRGKGMKGGMMEGRKERRTGERQKSRQAGRMEVWMYGRTEIRKKRGLYQGRQEKNHFTKEEKMKGRTEGGNTGR